MEKLSKEREIIKILFKDFLTLHNSRTISKLIGISHAGAFKILKKLEKRGIVAPKKIGNTTVYSLNAGNPIASKEVELALIMEAENFKRWSEDFKELENKVNFLILFGSILKNEKEAKDIDLLIVAEKKNFKDIEKIIGARKRISNKKIHPLIQTSDNFKSDVNKRNKTMIEILKKGIVLFGQEEIRKILCAKRQFSE